MNVKSIVITGGPCAGKTSAIEALRPSFANQGIPAIFVPEAATDLINAEIAPWTCLSMLEFQTRVIALQLERETAALRSAAAQDPAALVICDRGVCDSRAYLDGDEYSRALQANGLDEQAALDRYDSVFCLESIAKADLAAYTADNNRARFENAAEAVLADDRTARAWSEHPHLTTIENEEDFYEKLGKLELAIKSRLGLQ